MKKLSPLFIIATGLVMLSCAIVLMGDFFFSYLPDRQAETRIERQRIADTLAVPVIGMLSRGETKRMTILLNQVVARDSDILSAAVRKSDGHLLVATENHLSNWTDAQDSEDPAAFAIVPIETNTGPWGGIEFSFKQRDPGILGFLNRHPGLAALFSIIAFGYVSYGLYMRRVLHQFDPNSVIPERVRAAFDAMTEGVVIVDGEGRIALANNKFRQMGYTPEKELTAEFLSSILWLESRLSEDSSFHPWNRSMREKRQIIGEELIPNDENEDAERVVVNCAPISDARNQVRGCMVTFDDITELHHANQQLEQTLEHLSVTRRELEKKAADLQRLASVDYLTGVLNRRAFTEQAGEAFGVASQQRHVFSCIMIDIDHFKSINDTFGHGVGDLVIQAMAEVLTVHTRDEDKVGRLGGEEFCIALPNSGLETALEVAQRIRVAIETELVNSIEQLEGRVVTASVGVAVYQRQHTSLQALIESSDQALYEAKETGRNKVCVSDTDRSITA